MPADNVESVQPYLGFLSCQPCCGLSNASVWVFKKFQIKYFHTQPRLIPIFLDIEAFTTSTSTLRVGIMEDEFGNEIIINIIHLGTYDMHQGSRIDEDFAAFYLYPFIEFVSFIGIVESIRHPIATPCPKADSHTHRTRRARGKQITDSRSCVRRHLQRCRGPSSARWRFRDLRGFCGCSCE